MWSPRQVARLHIYPLCGIFYFPWHRHQIEGTNGFYCLIRKTERFTISNVESQVFTPNNSRLDPGSNPGCPRDKRMSYHWTNCASVRTKHTAYEKLTTALRIKYFAQTLEENNNVNSSIFTVFPLQYFHVICYAKTGDRACHSRVRILLAALRFGTLAIPFTPLGQCL